MDVVWIIVREEPDTNRGEPDTFREELDTDVVESYTIIVDKNKKIIVRDAMKRLSEEN